MDNAEKFQFDERCPHTQSARLIMGNPLKNKGKKNWKEPRVAPIVSLRNRINPETGRKHKFDDEKENS